MKYRRPMRYVGVLVFLVACSIEQPPEEVETVFGPPVGEREQQGTTILGGLDTVGWIGAQTVPYYVTAKARLASGLEVDVTTADTVLVVGGVPYSTSSTVYDLMTFTGYDQRKLQVTGVLPAQGDHPIRYRLSLDGADPCGGEAAIPVRGTYTIDARFQPSASITFSCEKGEVYKCRRFGYGADANPNTIKGQLHQACVYMAGARYCTDRRSFTREGTEIAMFDQPGARLKFPPDWKLTDTPPRPPTTWTPWELSTWPPPYDGFWIEAAWRADGTPLCLARTRWASMEEDPCDGALPDPRVVAGASYCEELFHEGLATPSEVLLVNTSRVNDARFDMWRTSSGDLVATARGFVDDDHDGPTVTRPFGASGGGMTYVGKVGVLLRVPTEAMLPDVIAVNTYCKAANTNECVVSTAQPPGHTNYRGPEGYLFRTNKYPNTAKLWLWRNASDDYVSAITAPDMTYDKVTPNTPLGWIFLPPS